MFLDNKYSRWYHSIISNRMNNPIDTSIYGERHHIIPRSMGGNNSKSNIVRLSPKEHFICHLLLVRMTTGRDKVKMSYALRMMSTVKNDLQDRYFIRASMYEMIVNLTKPIIGESMSGEDNPYYGKKHSTETRMKMKSKRALQPPPMLGKIRSEETKQKLRDAAIKQFSDTATREVQRQRSLKQFEDPANRYNAGNGKRGKKWYYDPITYHSILCFEKDIPHGYVPGRKLKKIERRW